MRGETNQFSDVSSDTPLLPVKTACNSVSKDYWQRGYLGIKSDIFYIAITGNTGEGTGETGTDGDGVTGKSGEGIGSTGVAGV
jgi:hypothetical protein